MKKKTERKEEPGALDQYMKIWLIFSKFELKRRSIDFLIDQVIALPKEKLEAVAMRLEELPLLYVINNFQSCFIEQLIKLNNQTQEESLVPDVGNQTIEEELPMTEVNDSNNQSNNLNSPVREESLILVVAQTMAEELPITEVIRHSEFHFNHLHDTFNQPVPKTPEVSQYINILNKLNNQPIKLAFFEDKRDNEKFVFSNNQRKKEPTFIDSTFDTTFFKNSDYIANIANRIGSLEIKELKNNTDLENPSLYNFKNP